MKCELPLLLVSSSATHPNTADDACTTITKLQPFRDEPIAPQAAILIGAQAIDFAADAVLELSPKGIGVHGAR